MTEYKRYVQFEFPYDEFAVKDNKINEELWNPQVVDRLNEQDEEIQRLRLINNGLHYALRNIKKIEVEIDLDDDGDVE